MAGPARALLLLLAAAALQGAEAAGLDAGSRRQLGLLRRGRRTKVPSGSLEGESCFEANAKAPVITETLQRRQLLFEVYQGIFSDCGTGNYNVGCVTNVFFAEKPKEYLEFCSQQMGPQPSASGAVCNYAKSRRDELWHDVQTYGTLATMMKNAATNCLSTPLQCVMLAEECLSSTDVRWCFNRCVRTGSMAHAMDTTTLPGRAGATLPPLPTAAIVTTTAWVLPTTTTTLGFWDSIVKSVDEALK